MKLQSFKDKVRIDVQTSTPGLVFKKVWQNRETMNYQGQDFYVVSRKDLLLRNMRLDEKLI